MKVAVCLTGQMRNYEETYPSFKRNVLDVCDADVYIHTYDTRGWTLNANRNPSSVGNYNIDGFDRTSPQIQFDSVISLYDPVKITVENWMKIESLIKTECSFVHPDRYHCSSENPMNVWSQWRKWYLCLQHILDSSTQYDYIVRYRPDMHIDIPISLMEDDAVHTPSEHSYGMISDIHAVGKMEPMKKYLSIYKHARELYETTTVPWNPHMFLMHYLNAANVRYCVENLGIHK